MHEEKFLFLVFFVLTFFYFVNCRYEYELTSNSEENFIITTKMLKNMLFFGEENNPI